MTGPSNPPTPPAAPPAVQEAPTKTGAHFTVRAKWNDKVFQPGDPVPRQFTQDEFENCLAHGWIARDEPAPKPA